MSNLEAVFSALEQFVDARDWSQFHTPRNLALALGGEVGELQAELQWVDDGAVEGALDDGLRDRLQAEAADVFIYLLLFAKSCDFDLTAATLAKLALNEDRFLVEEVRGSADRPNRRG